MSMVTSSVLHVRAFSVATLCPDASRKEFERLLFQLVVSGASFATAKKELERAANIHGGVHSA